MASETRRSVYSLRIQSVLHNSPIPSVERALTYLEAAAKYARRDDSVSDVVIAYGDCSPHRTLDGDALSRLRAAFPGLKSIEYTYFGANLGSAEGHNRLLKDAKSDLVTIFNPDVLASPNLFKELIDGLSAEGVGFVEARQLPIEHPKEFNLQSGETSWGSTACLIGPLTLYKQLDGFDSSSFFLYGDDVDLSWRARLAGRKVVHRATAVVFHDKRVDDRGCWVTTAAERYYSAEAALMLTHKYSRPDVTRTYLHHFKRSGVDELVRAAETFEMRQRQGQLPMPVDVNHRVGQFVGTNYAQHRFAAR